MSEKKQLNDNDLDEVVGGRILNATGMPGSDINNPLKKQDRS